MWIIIKSLMVVTTCSTIQRYTDIANLHIYFKYTVNQLLINLHVMNTHKFYKRCLSYQISKISMDTKLPQVIWLKRETNDSWIVEIKFVGRSQPAIVNKNMTYILIDLQYGRTVYMWKAFPGSAKYITISEMTYMYS